MFCLCSIFGRFRSPKSIVPGVSEHTCTRASPYSLMCSTSWMTVRCWYMLQASCIKPPIKKSKFRFGHRLYSIPYLGPDMPLLAGARIPAGVTFMLCDLRYVFWSCEFFFLIDNIVLIRLEMEIH